MIGFRAASLLFCILVAGVPAAAKDGLSVYPRIGQAPQQFRIKVTVENPETAVKVCVAADGPQYRVSCWEHPSRTTQVEWRDFPGGHYQFVMEITRKDGKTVQFQDTACVVGAINDDSGGCGED